MNIPKSATVILQRKGILTAGPAKGKQAEIKLLEANLSHGRKSNYEAVRHIFASLEVDGTKDVIGGTGKNINTVIQKFHYLNSLII